MGTTSPNYVRFIRGTPKAWANLKVKDEDCLYFISDKNAKSGQLFLGSKLISGTGSGTSDIIGSGYTELRDMDDVFLSVEISDGSVLVYEDGAWTNKVLEFPEAPKVMTGATDFMPGESGLVPRPRAGENGYYLRGDGMWDDLGGTLEAYMISLYGKSDRTQSIQQIASQEVSKLLGENVPEDLNTIEKIAKWILSNGAHTEEGDGAKRLEALEETTYGKDKTSKTDGLVKTTNDLMLLINGNQDETHYIEGLVPAVDRLDAGFTGLNASIKNIQKKYTNLSTTVTGLESRLKWQDY